MHKEEKLLRKKNGCLSDHIKQSTISVIANPKGESQGWGAGQNNIKRDNGQNFSKFEEICKPEFQEVQQTPSEETYTWSYPSQSAEKPKEFFFNVESIQRPKICYSQG